MTEVTSVATETVNKNYKLAEGEQTVRTITVQTIRLNDEQKTLSGHRFRKGSAKSVKGKAMRVIAVGKALESLEDAMAEVNDNSNKILRLVGYFVTLENDDGDKRSRFRLMKAIAADRISKD